MLETNGMPSAWARLQHASLSSFGKAKQGSTWEDYASEEQSHQRSTENEFTATEGHGFEEGVVRVQSELQSAGDFDQNDDGYDLLPLPVPAPYSHCRKCGESYFSSTE
jgi:hypothetical protein